MLRRASTGRRAGDGGNDIADRPDGDGLLPCRNRSSHEIAAIAAYNVAPEISGAWFDKISCFCFTEQRLGPGESAELPVVFFLDPRLERVHEMDGISEVTLSYTLFKTPETGKPLALAPGAGANAPKTLTERASLDGVRET